MADKNNGESASGRDGVFCVNVITHPEAWLKVKPPIGPP